MTLENGFWVLFIVLLSITLVASCYLFYLNRKMRTRYGQLTEQMRHLLYYRDMMLRQSMDEDGMCIDAVEDPDRKRFLIMDRDVMQQKLFLQPDFGRDDLMRMLGVDKNEVAAIIHRHSGLNVAGYLNAKRIEYALSLMKEHPEYTFSYIAEASGLKNQTTFIRNFKLFFGMTPSEYRQNYGAGSKA